MPVPADLGPAKVCNTCRETKLPVDFHRSRNTPTGRYPQCRRCRASQRRDERAANPEAERARSREQYVRHRESRLARNRRYYLANPERSFEYARARHLRRAYGLTVEDYAALMAAQQGGCASCGQPETEVDPRVNRVRQLAVDHCHETGEIRGLLCRKCNTALGLLGESLSVVEALAEYLRRSRDG